jgi:hypothetical protein
MLLYFQAALYRLVRGNSGFSYPLEANMSKKLLSHEIARCEVLLGSRLAICGLVISCGLVGEKAGQTVPPQGDAPPSKIPAGNIPTANPETAADMIFSNGKVLTMDGAGTNAQALAGKPHEFYINGRRILFSAKIGTFGKCLAGNQIKSG